VFLRGFYTFSCKYIASSLESPQIAIKKVSFRATKVDFNVVYITKLCKHNSCAVLSYYKHKHLRWIIFTDLSL